ncbi:MAG: 6-carboxytetrahydropterin synthase [Chloroflexi bacterium]|nr:6-carboxytetrahydropterin synthase [Chloroflexota bacterium]
MALDRFRELATRTARTAHDLPPVAALADLRGVAGAPHPPAAWKGSSDPRSGTVEGDAGDAPDVLASDNATLHVAPFADDVTARRYGGWLMTLPGVERVRFLELLEGEATFRVEGTTVTQLVGQLVSATALGVDRLQVSDSTIRVQLLATSFQNGRRQEPGVGDRRPAADGSRPRPFPVRWPGPEGRHSSWYELGSEFFFNARHSVVVDGQPGSIHAHSWRVRVTIAERALDINGMVVGFAAVHEAVRHELARWEDRYLNRIEPFDVVPPTAENIAAVLYRRLHRGLRDRSVRIGSVGVWETPTHYVIYRESPD